MKHVVIFIWLGWWLLAMPVNAKTLEDYLPVLPDVLAKKLPVDPTKGYLVSELKPSVYLLTDGIWQSIFVTTGKGVILLDAPETLGPNIIKAVRETTEEPIKLLVYTHAHVDHIGGSKYLKDIHKLKILASDSVAHFLKEKQDPRRLIPTKTFDDHYTIKMGHAKIKLEQYANYHSNEGDLFVYMPHQKLLMVIDSLAPGYVPFMGFDLTSNFHEYLKLFDNILAYKFDVFVGGHLSHTGTREDVLTAKDYAFDVYQTTKRIHQNTDLLAVMANAADRIGWDNKYLLFKVFLDKVINECTNEIEKRWLDKLAGVDVWATSHCRTALIYVRWDD